jgi:hypothetical protein
MMRVKSALSTLQVASKDCTLFGSLMSDIVPERKQKINDFEASLPMGPWPN